MKETVKDIVSISQLVKDLNLDVVYMPEEKEYFVKCQDVNRTALPLAGYFEYFPYERIQIIGKTEYTYFQNLCKEKRETVLDKFFSYEIPVLIVTRGLEVDEDIINTTKRMYDEKNKVRDEKITIHEIYLGKYKEMDYNNISEKEKNLAMLNCTSIKKMEELAQGSKIRGKIMEKFKKKLSAEEFAEILFDPEEDQEMILNSERLEGIEEGIESGKKEEKLEIAKKMLDEKMSLESISRLTGLNITEIKKIAK